MSDTTIFLTNRSQAVRLAKDVAFPAHVREVTILKEGMRRIITPAGALWDDFFASPGIDIAEREQPEAETREAF